MPDLPLVSVVIACFNSVRYLSCTIDSVLNQTYKNIELILVDDCSTDGTVALINEYIARDQRIRLIQRKQRGGRPAITKNTGLEYITGEFVCFLDHDDYYHPKKIEYLLSILIQNPECIAAFHDIDLVDEHGNFLNKYLDNFTVEANQYLQGIGTSKYICNIRFFAFQSIKYAAIHTISIMIAIERFGRNNLSFDTRFQVCDDTDLWIRLGLSGQMIYLDESLASYRQHGTNITRNQIKVQEDALILMEYNFIRISDKINQQEKKLLANRISSYYDDLGWMYRCKKIRKKSINAYINAWKWSKSGKHLLHAIKAIFPVRKTEAA
ncbi:glycosyltransferase [Dechloromonas denitrificans]|uniref:glycosyltransferase n=1 Tax=Dechloromonas denitrificans TaxID=281362 RepID=UPI0009FB82DD|nr:glycosyltransferase [Dechloromonas denitrificans]